MSVKSSTEATKWVVGGTRNSLRSAPSSGWAWFGSDTSVMARDRIKSKASPRSEGRTGNRGPVGLCVANSARLCSLDADLESSELASRGEFGTPMTRRVPVDPRLAEDVVAFGSSGKRFVVGESPVGSKFPFSDEVVCSGSKAKERMVVGLWVEPDDGSNGFPSWG